MMAEVDALKHSRLRQRAVRLLEQFFANDGEAGRRTLFNLTFGDCARDPRRTIDFKGATIEFADHAVGKLLAFGCADRGRHSLSLLIETMAQARGRQADPDFAELPRLLDARCALPTRDEELAYLERLLADIRAKARKYSALQAVGRLNGSPAGTAAMDEDLEEADIALLRLKRGVERESREFEDILQAFGQVRTAALLGAPGAGKSTTLRRLAADLAKKAQSDHAAPLPLFVALGEWDGDEPLDAFVAAHIPEIGWALDGLARVGRLVLLLDGLNEVPTAKRKAKAEDVKGQIRRLGPASTAALSRSHEPPPRAQIIVSCRRDDYRDELDLGLDTLMLEPLTPRRVRAALHQWVSDRGEPPPRAEQLFWQLAGDDKLAPVFAAWQDAGRGEDAFWAVSDPWNAEDIPDTIDWEGRWIWRRCVQDPRSLLRLAANPFMLNMLYQVWRAGGELPRNRGDLFARFVDRLLAREHLAVKQDDSGAWVRTHQAELLLRGLVGVAMSMQVHRRVLSFAHAGTDEQATEFGVLTVLARRDVVRLLGNGDGSALEKTAEDATILERDAEHRVRFRHQLLQEYFTALALQQLLEARGMIEAQLWDSQRWWERSGWEESAVLLAGLRTDDCTPVIRWLRDAQPEVAAQCILESGAALLDRAALYRELHDAWLPRLTDIEREPAPEARAAIGRALGRLGLDDRKGVGLNPEGLPDIDWVEIPGGEFIYQEGERRTGETFRIARDPVTHAQFQAFLDAEDGYANDRWWVGLDVPDRNPAQAGWPISNHPRETVSWFEAMAFCAWLSHRLGKEIRLPTEWEWERAARGTDGRDYPWGGEYRRGYANINETSGDAGPHYLAQTSAVGIYTQGASPEGVMDLAGNVWEWCLNEYDNPERVGPEGSEPRVVRGGSWVYPWDLARAGYRSYRHPDGRLGLYGFRVVCSSPIR
jgi:hypothetical protein